jgi:hypothetical protein
VKVTILSLLTLIPLVAIAAVYDALESGANLIEALLLPFATDQTATGALVFGGPFIVLFIAALVVQFVGVPLIASSIAAYLGGWALRQSRKCISKRSARLCICLATVCAIVFVLVASQRDGFLPVSRPPQKPKTPAIVLACVAGANAAFSMFVGTFILRRITFYGEPPPIPKSHPTHVA